MGGRAMKGLAVLIGCTLGFGGCSALTGGLPSDRLEEPGLLLTRAVVVLNDVLVSPAGIALDGALDSAAGVLIVPDLTAAGTQWGVSGGVGVLLGRDPASGAWSAPSFHRLTGVSGSVVEDGAAVEAVLVVRDPVALQAIAASSIDLGDEVSVESVPEGAGFDAELGADVAAWTVSGPAMVALSLEGARLAPLTRWIEVYYGDRPAPAELVGSFDRDDAGAHQLRESLRRASST